MQLYDNKNSLQKIIAALLLGKTGTLLTAQRYSYLQHACSDEFRISMRVWHRFVWFALTGAPPVIHDDFEASHKWAASKMRGIVNDGRFADTEYFNIWARVGGWPTSLPERDDANDPQLLRFKKNVFEVCFLRTGAHHSFGWTNALLENDLLKNIRDCGSVPSWRFNSMKSFDGMMDQWVLWALYIVLRYGIFEVPLDKEECFLTTVKTWFDDGGPEDGLETIKSALYSQRLPNDGVDGVFRELEEKSINRVLGLHGIVHGRVNVESPGWSYEFFHQVREHYRRMPSQDGLVARYNMSEDPVERFALRKLIGPGANGPLGCSYHVMNPGDPFGSPVLADTPLGSPATCPTPEELRRWVVENTLFEYGS